MRIVALIPARAGSKRIPGKNTKLLYGKPLIQWTIEAAQASNVFNYVCVCTDDSIITRTVNCNVFNREPSSDSEPDIVWVRKALDAYDAVDAFAILRPTSPFRTARTIAHGVNWFQRHQPADSLRAVRAATEHPGKMWMIQRGTVMIPLLPYWTRTGDEGRDTPWHSAPTQTLPSVYIQTAGLEIAWRKTVTEHGSISGTMVIPFLMNEYEGFDINTPDDWARAEALAPSLLGGVQTAAPA